MMQQIVRHRGYTNPLYLLAGWRSGQGSGFVIGRSQNRILMVITTHAAAGDELSTHRLHLALPTQYGQRQVDANSHSIYGDLLAPPGELFPYVYFNFFFDAEAVNVAFDTDLGGFGLSAVLSVLTGATLLPHLIIKHCKACHH